MSRRTCQILYVIAGVLVMTGMPLGLLLGGELGNLIALSLITLGLLVASAAIYVDISGRSQRAHDATEHPPEGREAAAARRARAQERSRRAERSLALERERERQREGHDALARRAAERGQTEHGGSPPRRRSAGHRRPRRP